MAVSAGAYLLQGVESRLFGHAWLESLVLAILLGTAVRSLWAPSTAWVQGINFSAKYFLELAVLLLGSALNVVALKAAGVGLLVAIVVIVPGAIVLSYVIGRALGLQRRMALLIACGNAICGNSAIAAVAPVIGARSDDVAASIAFTAVMGVGVVLGLPLLLPLLHLNHLQYGTLAGLTVYAVPQVLAATISVSQASANIGTLVKLVRVLMLGPIMLTLTLLMRSRSARSIKAGDTKANAMRTPGIAWHKIVPWFIIGFLILMAMRSADLIPSQWLAPINGAANGLTIVSMAALGLGVDIRSVSRAGPRVTLTVVLSLLALIIVSLTLVRVLHFA
jgi:uncharacterized integral membrane protein (TIGR00698 family)